MGLGVYTHHNSMMDIKHRAWDKLNNCMLENVTTDLLSESHLIFMTYTGFKDNKNREIYEEDILKVTCLDNNYTLKEYTTRVIWEDGAFVIKSSDNISYYDTYLGAYKNSNTLNPIVELEIIGNIYEGVNY